MDDNIRKLPAQSERVETGPVQFGDDWPGVFIRGDNAFAFCNALDALLHASQADPIMKVLVSGLRSTLASADITGLSKVQGSASGGSAVGAIKLGTPEPGEPLGVQGLDAVTADAERLCWALRPLVLMVPAGDKLCWVRFKIGPQEFTIGNEPMPEDEAAHFAGLFVFALAAAFRTLPTGVAATSCPHGVPHRWPCEKCDAAGVDLPDGAKR